jgi:hypothetical protein
MTVTIQWASSDLYKLEALLTMEGE